MRYSIATSTGPGWSSWEWRDKTCGRRHFKCTAAPSAPMIVFISVSNSNLRLVRTASGECIEKCRPFSRRWLVLISHNIAATVYTCATEVQCWCCAAGGASYHTAVGRGVKRKVCAAACAPPMCREHLNSHVGLAIITCWPARVHPYYICNALGIFLFFVCCRLGWKISKRVTTLCGDQRLGDCQRARAMTSAHDWALCWLHQF